MASFGRFTRPPEPHRRDFWARWPVRIVMVLAVVAAVCALAMIGDSEPESALVKVGELLRHVSDDVIHGPSAAPRAALNVQ